VQQEGEIVFVGVYERSVDDNGRLALPAPFRGELGDRCYATLDPQGCVTVRTSATFESEAAEMMDAVKDGRASSAQRRNLATSTIAVSVDKQGRITLEDKARRHAGLDSGTQVMIVGNLTTLELWRPSRYRTIEAEDELASGPRVWDDHDGGER